MKIFGKNIDLIAVTIADAEFILALRQDPDLNQHLSFVDNDLAKQKQWLQQSVSNDNEYYYLIKNKQNVSIGTIRIYDIKNDVFCWGSWIVLPQYRKYASFESILLLYKFAFIDLGFKETNFDVRKNNKKALDFYLRFGAQITSENDQDYFLNYTREYFLDQFDSYQKIVENLNLI